MKKLIYIMLLAISASLVMTSCTEENIAPKAESGGGGSSSDKGGY